MMAGAAPVPLLRADPGWPLPLPHGWALGEVSGVATDAAGDVWILQRPATMVDRRRAKAPPVIEFDAGGHVLRAWGGAGPGYDWFESEHGISVDAQGFVWLSGNGAYDGEVLKFTRDGAFVLQIGRPGQGADSRDTTRLGRPAGMAVDTAAHEVYVADGYANRRVIVFDSITGAFHRMWGAYGGVPDDTPRRQFGTPVHCVRLSHDGLVYVCDRRNDRVQVFLQDGRFVTEWVVAPRTGGMGSVWDLAFSADAAQSLVFVADGTNNVVHILRRSDGALLGAFGAPGQFSWLHGIAADAHGDLFTGEVHEAKRAQKFIPR
jgi:DNA-binding beta-propeller fold protein YncE